MKFLCVVLVDDGLASLMTGADWVQMDRDSLAYDQALAERGVLIAAEALHGRGSVRTLRVRNGDALVTDGPFMESKETIGGFILIDVADFEAAMEVAARIPMARLGAIEVRPVMEFR